MRSGLTLLWRSIILMAKKSIFPRYLVTVLLAIALLSCSSQGTPIPILAPASSRQLESSPSPEPSTSPCTQRTATSDLSLRLEISRGGELNNPLADVEVLKSEMVDIVVLGEDNKIRHAGQEIQTSCGDLTIPIVISSYKKTYECYFEEFMPSGGYPDFAESTLVDEIGRII